MDAVLHLAAIPNPFADPPERVFDVNVRGTSRVKPQSGPDSAA